jgi:ATP-dependent DNA helicase RecG
MNKLPEILNQSQKKNKIGNLLSTMKRMGLIENEGSDKNPKWICKKFQ